MNGEVFGWYWGKLSRWNVRCIFGSLERSITFASIVFFGAPISSPWAAVSPEGWNDGNYPKKSVVPLRGTLFFCGHSQIWSNKHVFLGWSWLSAAWDHVFFCWYWRVSCHTITFTAICCSSAKEWRRTQHHKLQWILKKKHMLRKQQCLFGRLFYIVSSIVLLFKNQGCKELFQQTCDQIIVD